MSFIGRPNDSIIDYVVAIADALAGTESPAYTGNDDRLRHALYRIGDYFGKNAPASGASIPEPKDADKGKYLKVDSSTGKPVWADLPANNDNGGGGGGS